MVDRYMITAYGARINGHRQNVTTRGGLEHEPARQQFKFFRDRNAWCIKVYKTMNGKPVLITDWRDIRR